MRKFVVDTNFLKSSKLNDFVADSTNFAVIPDLAILETLKGRDPKSISDQLKTLADHSSQVRVLKSTHAIAGLRARRRSRGLQKRLIDRNQTASFKPFCEKVDAAVAGDKVLQKQLAGKCDAAESDLDQIAKLQETYVQNLAEHAKTYTDAELRILRKGEAISAELFNKITEQIFNLARHVFTTHSYYKKLPPFETLHNSFIFRFAVAGYVLALRCIKEGGATGASAETIRNHMVDVMVATHATYFDGLLTEDKKAQELFETTCNVLKILRGGMERFNELQAAAQSEANNGTHAN